MSRVGQPKYVLLAEAVKLWQALKTVFLSYKGKNGSVWKGIYETRLPQQASQNSGRVKAYRITETGQHSRSRRFVSSRSFYVDAQWMDFFYTAQRDVKLEATGFYRHRCRYGCDKRQKIKVFSTARNKPCSRVCFLFRKSADWIQKLPGWE
jgi:hypothetical protein